MWWCLSLAPMTDGLYVVAVRIAHEGSEVVRVVLGPQARLVKYLSTAGDCGIEERLYRRAIGCGDPTCQARVRPVVQSKSAV